MSPFYLTRRSARVVAFRAVQQLAVPTTLEAVLDARWLEGALNNFDAGGQRRQVTNKTEENQ